MCLHGATSITTKTMLKASSFQHSQDVFTKFLYAESITLTDNVHNIHVVNTNKLWHGNPYTSTRYANYTYKNFKNQTYRKETRPFHLDNYGNSYKKSSHDSYTFGPHRNTGTNCSPYFNDTHVNLTYVKARNPIQNSNFISTSCDTRIPFDIDINSRIDTSSTGYTKLYNPHFRSKSVTPPLREIHPSPPCNQNYKTNSNQRIESGYNSIAGHRTPTNYRVYDAVFASSNNAERNGSARAVNDACNSIVKKHNNHCCK